MGGGSVGPLIGNCPNLLTPDLVKPDHLTPDLVTPDLVTPNLITPDLVTPYYVTPDYVSPDYVTPNLVTLYSNKDFIEDQFHIAEHRAKYNGLSARMLPRMTPSAELLDIPLASDDTDCRVTGYPPGLRVYLH